MRSVYHHYRHLVAVAASLSNICLLTDDACFFYYSLLLSPQHEHLPAEIQAVQDPGEFYLAGYVEEAKVRREERELLQA